MYLVWHATYLILSKQGGNKRPYMNIKKYINIIYDILQNVVDK